MENSLQTRQAALKKIVNRSFTLPKNINHDAQLIFREVRSPLDWIGGDCAQHLEKAIKLINQKKFHEALPVLEDIYKLPQKDTHVTGEFVGLVEIHKAYALMDLQRYDEAKLIFTGKELVENVMSGQLCGEDTFYYFYSYANTLAPLGDAQNMELQMTHALNLAALELKDAKLCEVGWESLLKLCGFLKQWERMIELSMDAVVFAKASEQYQILFKSVMHRVNAYRKLKNYEKALVVSNDMLEMCRKNGLVNLEKMWIEMMNEIRKEIASQK